VTRLEYYPLDFIERHIVRPAIIVLRRARAGLVRGPTSQSALHLHIKHSPRLRRCAQKKQRQERKAGQRPRQQQRRQRPWRSSTNPNSSGEPP
jgi:hypothetical protein